MEKPRGEGENSVASSVSVVGRSRQYHVFGDFEEADEGSKYYEPEDVKEHLAKLSIKDIA
ncbi:MAG: hypothetical protein QXU67_01020 [Candidatus Bathyarchaeia archaeon]